MSYCVHFHLPNASVLEQPTEKNALELMGRGFSTGLLGLQACDRSGRSENLWAVWGSEKEVPANQVHKIPQQLEVSGPLAAEVWSEFLEKFQDT